MQLRRLLCRCDSWALTQPPHSTGSVPRGALCAEPAENKFGLAQNPLTERTRSRFPHFVPFDILNIPAAVTDEVMVPHAFRIESCGAALDGHFTH
jgi:hypothetical protein